MIIALMIEAVSTPESWSTSTRLYGTVSQTDAIFISRDRENKSHTNADLFS
jgi:hypothetical protein